MQFSDTSAKAGLVQYAEVLTGLGDAAISGNTTLLAQFTSLINRAYHKVVTMVLDSQDEWDFDDNNHSDYAVLSASVVANQRDYQIPVGEKVLKIKRLDISYDGTNFYKAEPFDINESGLGMGLTSDSTQEATIDGRFERTQPKYDLRGNSIWIYPRADATDVANGGKIRIEWTREIDEFTVADTTQEPGIDEPFHPLIVKLACVDYLLGHDQNKADRIKRDALEDEQRLKTYYSDKQEDRNNVLKAAFVDYE